jgi:small ligand-binding sensory domain FIST
MKLIRGMGYTQNADSRRAGRILGETVHAGMDGRTPDILFLFATVGHDFDKLIAGIAEVFGDAPLAGCSGAGILAGRHADESTHSATLLGIAAEGIRFSPFLRDGLGPDPGEAGRAIGRRIRDLGIAPESPHFVILLPDGLTVNADPLLAGIEDALGYSVDCVGGTAGNDYLFSETFQFAEGRVARDAVAGVVVSGDVRYRIGASHGSEPLGLFRTVTRSRNNIVHEIDGRPAVDLLRTFLGEDRMADLGQVINLFELGQAFEDRDYSGDIINRAIIGIDAAAGSLTLGAEVAQGSKIRLTRRDPDRVLAGTRETTARVLAGLDDPDRAVFLYFPCSGRGAYLFGESDPDVRTLHEALGPGREAAGFFCFGEIAPVRGRNVYHNYTGVLLGFEAGGGGNGR